MREKCKLYFTELALLRVQYLISGNVSKQDVKVLMDKNL